MSRRSRRIQGIEPEVSNEEAQRIVQHRQREQQKKPTSRPTPRPTPSAGPAQAGRRGRGHQGKTRGRGRGSGSGYHAGGQSRQDSTRTEEPTAQSSTGAAPREDEQVLLEAARNIAYRARQYQQASSSSSSAPPSSPTHKEIIGVLKQITGRLEQQQQQQHGQASSSTMEQQGSPVSPVLGKRQRDTSREDEEDKEEQKRENRAHHRHRMLQLSEFLNEPTQLARKAAVVLYQNRMEQELEIAIDYIYKFLRTGSGGRNRDPRIVRERMAFLRFWDTLIRDYELTIATRLHSMYEYKELIWKWEDIYNDCVSLANTPIDPNDSVGHQVRVARFVSRAKKLINDDV
ncbi:hypothetical protein BDB00DRAFT_933678 [Zychaea mexicana]|uniref:uncharacterized protein n=1 Tax=Zychaea mexicana TaxID=64656 RepID=UPI0022FDEAE3|nr:uncharacterized protein BDB00DRAFT_933678 [Zychaea mexicana]KAI9484437.1 hypothetical protein BDB00DRAFT_933678 [Zychaea mexicana]